MKITGTARQRIAIFLVSLIIILVEIALIRELALRFWEHLAWLIISIALLGFGASGTLLVLVHRYLRIHQPTLQLISLTGMGISLPASLWLADKIDINLIQLVWQPSTIWRVGALEVALATPFLFGGMFIALVLEDKAERIPGHYAASFLGSGVGGFLVLPALYLLTPRLLILGSGGLVLFIALLYIQEKNTIACWLASFLLLILMTVLVPHATKISEDKDLPQLLALPGSTINTSRYSPQGLVEVVEAPAYHAAPGLALNTPLPVPPQRLLTLDARIVGSIYKSTTPSDFDFLKYSTLALPYQLNRPTHALITSDEGTDQVGLALSHGVERITALTDNQSIAAIKSGELSPYSGHIYNLPKVSLNVATVRGYLKKTTQNFPLIIFPTIGTDPGGLAATAPDSLLTRETFRLCFSRLTEGGALSISTYLYSPPRESLRLLNMLIDTLQQSGREPARHIVMIRNWATATLVATKRSLSTTQLMNIRSFSRQRGFDLVWLPDLQPQEVNKYHQLDTADYYLGAKLLFGEEHSHFIANYVYMMTPPDDNKPFFSHFSRWRPVTEVTHQLGKRGRAYLELGSVLLFAALFQAFILATAFILLPLVPAIGLPGKKLEQLVVLGFFITLGLGFMLLEVGMLQRLTIYLAHPVWATATVLSGFLFFGGIGSTISSRVPEPLVHRHCILGLAVVVVGSTMVLIIDWALASTEGLELPGRIISATLLIAPLATLMGMIFPLGLKRIGRNQTRLIPWAWSANGFTSVLATLCAPLLAMQWGFSLVAWTALGCYFLAALLSLKLPE